MKYQAVGEMGREEMMLKFSPGAGVLYVLAVKRFGLILEVVNYVSDSKPKRLYLASSLLTLPGNLFSQMP